MYAQLGDIIFEGLYGPEEYVRNDSVSLPQHSRINRRPKQQFTGVDLGVVKVTIQLHRSFINIEDAIAKFRTYRNRAEHLRYITGSGNVLGTFVISETVEKHLQTDVQGNVVLARLELTLIETVASSPSVSAVSRAQANRANRPAVVAIRVIPASIPMSAAMNVVTARSAAYSSNSIIEEYSTAPDDFTEASSPKLKNVREKVVTARENMASAAAKVQAAQETAEQAIAYVSNMYTAAQNAQTLQDYIDGFDPMDPVGSMNNINLANREFMSSVAVMSNTSQPLAAFTGARR